MKVAKKKTDTQRARLEKELSEAIKQVDEEGLIFLIQQAQVLIHNVQVDKINREIVELEQKKLKSGPQASSVAATAGRPQEPIPLPW